MAQDDVKVIPVYDDLDANWTLAEPFLMMSDRYQDGLADLSFIYNNCVQMTNLLLLIYVEDNQNNIELKGSAIIMVERLLGDRWLFVTVRGGIQKNKWNNQLDDFIEEAANDYGIYNIIYDESFGWAQQPNANIFLPVRSVLTQHIEV